MEVPTVNLANPNTDKTIKIFDTFYNFSIDVDANLYDIVYSFFASIFATKESASQFATSLFQVSETSGIPVLTLLEEMKGQNAMQVTSTVAFYLNDIRSNATLLGVGNVTTPNVYASRNILT
jgi:hypothetical protein